jgi:23S rRNA (pseudouridine1915-N3)-methyltransferase
MKIVLTAIAPRRTRSKSEAADRLFDEYVERAARYVACEAQNFETEAAFLEWVERQDRQPGRTAASLVLLDSRGQMLTSEEFAGHVRRLRDDGAQRVVMSIGPADGWSEAARKRGNLLVSLGRVTLPHSLARVVLAEQVYRALTILAGHPYHSGH